MGALLRVVIPVLIMSRKLSHLPGPQAHRLDFLSFFSSSREISGDTFCSGYHKDAINAVLRTGYLSFCHWPCKMNGLSALVGWMAILALSE
jgi:hypothetical protein